MPKFVLTMEEVYAAIREQYMLDSDIEIEFVPTKSLDSIQKDSGWQYVSNDWDKAIPPFDTSTVNRVEVVYRNGNTGTDSPCAFDWEQEFRLDDIIKYRIIS